MATTSAISIASPLLAYASSQSLFKPLPMRPSMVVPMSNKRGRFQVQASFKEKAITGLTAGVLTASMVVPQVAEAADGTLTPSLKNFLLSIAAGGIVLTAILGAIVGVSNFDPVKRG